MIATCGKGVAFSDILKRKRPGSCTFRGVEIAVNP